MQIDKIHAWIMLPDMTGKLMSGIIRLFPAFLGQIQTDAHPPVAAVQLHLTMNEIQHLIFRIDRIDIRLLLGFLRLHPAADPAGLQRIKRFDKQHGLHVIPVFNQRQGHRFTIQTRQIVEIPVH